MPDPYASHIPVLRALDKKTPFWRVVEYGGGDYSTPFFLSLPHLERLVTVEDDPEWVERIRRKYADPRLVIAENAPTDPCDLIFIDNGISPPERVEVIHAVLSKPHPTVVIHDAEVPAYEQAIRESGKTYALHKKLTPNTAVVPPCAS